MKLSERFQEILLPRMNAAEIRLYSLNKGDKLKVTDDGVIKQVRVTSARMGQEGDANVRVTDGVYSWRIGTHSFVD